MEGASVLAGQRFGVEPKDLCGCTIDASREVFSQDVPEGRRRLGSHECEVRCWPFPPRTPREDPAGKHMFSPCTGWRSAPKGCSATPGIVFPLEHMWTWGLFSACSQYMQRHDKTPLQTTQLLGGYGGKPQALCQGPCLLLLVGKRRHTDAG